MCLSSLFLFKYWYIKERGYWERGKRVGRVSKIVLGNDLIFLERIWIILGSIQNRLRERFDLSVTVLKEEVYVES